MQLEDKVVEDFAAQREELQQREDLQERGEEELPEVQREALPDKTAQLRGKLLGAVRMVLQDESVSVEGLQLPQHEERALLALQYAVTGQGDLGQFLFACDRRDLLEQALAVLQPGMTDLDRKSKHDLVQQLEDMGAKVAGLRDVLTNLEEAQDEAIEGVLHREEQTGAPPADKGDKPKPDGSMTSGPEVPPKPDAVTTLTGGKEVTKADAVTTLGDPAELAEQAKQPWWRRPFG